MKIACIGWGSLIWQPGNLPIQSKWFEDGPILPIEFTRISQNGRVTLIIDEKARPLRTMWALMLPKKINDCIKALAQREGTDEKNINQISRNESTENNIKIIIKEWLVNNNLDTAIWTALSFSKETNNIRPSAQSVIKHLDKLLGINKTNAEEYIRKAPKQIDTEYRRKIEAKFGWTFMKHYNTNA